MPDILFTLALIGVIGFMLAWPTFVERISPFCMRLLEGRSLNPAKPEPERARR